MMDNPVVGRLRSMLAEARARKAPREEIAEILSAAKELLDEQSAGDPERQRDTNDTIGAVAQTVLGGMTFGIEGLIEDALSKGSFQENRDFRRANQAALPAKLAIPAGVAGAILNPAGAFFGPVKAGAGIVRTLGKGAIEGATQAGTAGTIENIGTTDDPTGLRHGATAAAFGAPFGAAGGAVGRRLAMGRAKTAGFGAPQRRLAESVAADATYQRPTLPTGVGAPTPRAIDVAGPTLTAEAKQAAKSIPGRQALKGAFEAKEVEAPIKIREAFDAATGTTALDADALAREIASVEKARALANVQQKANYDALLIQLKEAHRVAVDEAKRTALPKALAIVNEEAGGVVPNAIKTLETTKAQRGAQAAIDYPAAIEATKGQAIPLTKEQIAFLKSPTGQAAWKAAQRSREDVIAVDPTRALPEQVVETGKPQGFVPTSLGPGAALSKPKTEPVPDAEAWEFMKRYLANVSKMEPGQITPEGIGAEHVANVRDLFDVAYAARGEPFVKAAENYAVPSGQMDATRLGLARSRGNPLPQNALRTSLDAVESKVGEMPSDQAARFREARQYLIASMLREGKSPEQIARLLEEPTSDMSRLVEQAFGPGAPRRLGRRFQSLKPPEFQTLPKPTDIPMSPDITAAQRGLGITKTPSDPSATNLTKSLGELESEVPSMTMTQRQMLRRGAAADFRGGLDRGQPLKLDVPERARQFQFAARSPGDVRQMSAVERGWNDLLERQKNILSGEEQLPRPTEGLGELAVKAQTPSLGLTIARAIRQLYSHPFEARIKRLGLEDAEFNRTLLEAPEVLQRAVRELADVNQNAANKSAEYSARFGRIGPTLFPAPFR